MVDDATASYILATRKCFEDLRQVAAQIAGVLVLAEAGGKSATPEHPMLKAAAELLREAVDQVRSTPPTAAAHLHHEFLSQAGQSLALALAAAGRQIETTAILPPVREAYRYLGRASNALPGFPMVAFEQACCAVHVHS
ncbi:MAG TPA: hypothetical protein VMF64_08810 [Steroidobacteraceae bacterium]|nr:hypothetical protein [Steroidobacteraceae bacterium]